MTTVATSTGLMLPFFPMRPRHGRSLTVASVAYVLDRLETHVVQPKLNGDRACVLIRDGHVITQNRHGKWYSYGIRNESTLLSMPDNTILDGEVWEKNFYPFECLVNGGSSMLRNCVSERVDACIELCSEVGLEFKFHFNQDFIYKYAANLPVWEGVVLKMKGKPYIPLGTSSQESADWVKMKWNPNNAKS